MSAVPIRRRVVGIVLFLSLWLTGVLFFCLHILIMDYPTTRLDPFTPAILYGFPRITGEVILLYFILRPNSFRWSWHRALIAFALLVPWLFYSIEHIMHAPAWVFAHSWWIITLLCGLIILLVVSAVGAWLTRTKLIAT